MTIKSRLFLGFFILVMLFIVEAILNYKLSQAVIKNMNQLGNSETIIRNSNLLHKNLIEMQSGFRGYLLTGQENFLQPFYNGIKEVPPIISDQKLLLEKDIQRNRLDLIERKHKEWIEYANSLIITKRDTLPEANLLYAELFEKKLKKEVGKILNDEIRTIFIEFDAYEYKIRQEKRNILQESIKRTRVITQISTACSVLIAIIAALWITSVITRRIIKMVRFAEEISKGNFKTIQDDEKDELKKLSESLNGMSETLDRNFKALTKKNIELDQFAYVVSHDLKAPLRGIENLLKWTEEDYEKELSPGVKKNFELIKGRTNRLENLINGLLEYARIGRVESNMEKVDVHNLLNEIVEIIVPKSFNVVIKDNMPFIETQKLRLEQVFTNLLSNAVKYAEKSEGNIEIECRDLGDVYAFSVSDNGPGIPAQYHEKIFQIFQTLKERDAFESTGVGLSIVKKIIDEQKGTIKVVSEIGKGAKFIFTWPKEPKK